MFTPVWLRDTPRERPPGPPALAARPWWLERAARGEDAGAWPVSVPHRPPDVLRGAASGRTLGPHPQALAGLTTGAPTGARLALQGGAAWLKHQREMARLTEAR